MGMPPLIDSINSDASHCSIAEDAVGESLNPFLDSCVPCVYMYTHTHTAVKAGSCSRLRYVFVGDIIASSADVCGSGTFIGCFFAAPKASNISRINVIHLVLW